MGLRDVLLRIGAGHPAVLLACLPGATETRLAVEAGLRRRGWPVAASPAAASALVVVGAAGAADEEWVEGLWRQIPSPKARSAVAGAYDVEAALDTLVRPAAAPVPGDGGEHSADHDGPGGHADQGGHRDHDGHGAHGGPDDHDGHGGHDDHGGHGDHGGHDDHGGHGDHGEHHGHGGVVAGLPLAGRADDRDGLRLDRLHLPLGPGLADWPAGLVLDVALQGDVVQHAGVRTLPPPAPGGLPYWDEPWLRAARGEHVPRGTAARRRCAAHLDSAARLLAVSGWPDPAARA
ncbi:hypothetical protein, partial [Streptomyces synnematoformans]|uniref:hypothetical protein n=1 Tax=Streptomyces synnematoformans TaxID=415721 RepID=UPI0031CDBE8C